MPVIAVRSLVVWAARSMGLWCMPSIVSDHLVTSASVVLALSYSQASPVKLLQKERTYMNCPVDSTQLVMTDRQGVEIDYCPKCRGVWLDRGELDKIIDRGDDMAHLTARPQDSSYQERSYRPSSDDDDYRDNDRHGRDQYGHKKKREGFLGDLFDF
jgi:uncharacterized protein